jgi:hypothetical protein
VAYPDPDVWQHPADDEVLPSFAVPLAQGGQRIEPDL